MGFFPIFRPVTTIKTLQKYFNLIEEVLSFDLVGHMWKLVSKMHFLREILQKIIAGSFRVSLFIDLGFP